MSRKLALAKWVKVELAEIKQAAIEVQKETDWIRFAAAILMAVALGMFLSLPWLSEGKYEPLDRYSNSAVYGAEDAAPMER